MLIGSKAIMPSGEFNRLSLFIYQELGIKMPPAKKTMLESRLQKRLNVLGITSFKDYCDFLFSANGQQTELIHMLDVVTTNKTDFFREPKHFEFLQSDILPEWVSQASARRTLQIWSAGCSTGEEPYTLSMVLSEFSTLLDYSILATDISTEVLQKAQMGIYAEDRVNIIPLSLKKKYLLKSKDRVKPTVRMVPELRKRISFQRLNFMDNHYDVSQSFDIIFCRNVLIYFDRETQEKVIRKLCAKLKKGGYFFLGHSESITSLDVPLRQIRPTIFLKE